MLLGVPLSFKKLIIFWGLIVIPAYILKLNADFLILRICIELFINDDSNVVTVL